jgi:hypothetical protein
VQKVFDKIPLIVYAIVAIVFAIYLTHILENYLISTNWLTKNEGEARVALYSSVLTILGILYGVLQLQNQRKDSLFANEYINQPEFLFFRFSEDKLLENGNSPGCCCEKGKVCINNCIDEHWFDLKQIGNLPATELKISMFHSKASNNVCCDVKVKKFDTLNKNGKYQYKIPPYTYDEKLFDDNSTDKFIVLLSYKSLYSNLKYKRIYELNYSPKADGNLKDGLWGNNISFFGVQLVKITDYNSIKLRDILLGNIMYFLHKIKIKDTYTPENWILKY